MMFVSKVESVFADMDVAVSNVLQGGSTLLLGQWQVASAVAGLVSANGGKLDATVIDNVASTVTGAFGRLSRGVTVDASLNGWQMPNDGTVRTLAHAGRVLAHHVLAGDVLPAVDNPLSVWQNARTVLAKGFVKPSAADKAAGKPASKDEFLLAYFGHADNAATYIADYAAQREEANRLRREAAALKREEAKAAAKRDEARGNSTEPAATEPAATEPESELVAALNAALTKHGYDAVAAAVLPVLAKLGKPAATARRAGKAGKAANA